MIGFPRQTAASASPGHVAWRTNVYFWSMFRSLKKSLLFLLFIASAPAAFSQAATVPGDVLVMLRPGASARQLANDLRMVQGIPTELRVVREVSAPMRAWLFHFNPGSVAQDAMLQAFRDHRAVQMAQNNHVIAERAVPNDPQYGQQWQHQNIQSALAWDITTGGVTAAGDTIVVAIIENADLPHPDLAANAWINHGEIPGNGVDDDGNGYVDDVRGWNPAGNDDNVYGGSHGTEVAGMIGAVGNNGSQVTGANWQVKMMPVTYASSQEADVITSYTYPLVMRRLYNATNGAKGAFVVATNASWGVNGGQPADAPLWCAIYDTLGTAGVLNCGATSNSNVNVDVVGDLPTACPSDFMISVTATNNSDMRTFSGYGATTIDVGAPGASVFTTTNNGTGTATGTSFASPLTAGVIALMYSVPCASLAALAHNDPMEAALRVRQALFAGVDQVGNLPGNTVTGGRINAFNSVQLLMDSCQACPQPYNLAASSDAIGSATLGWNALPGTFTVRYRAQGASAWTESSGITGMELQLANIDACTAYEFQISADCDTATSAFSPSFFWTSEGCCTAPLSISATAIDTVNASITWTSVLASESYSLRWREVGETDWTYLQEELTGNAVELTGLVPCSDIEVQMGSLCELTDSEWSASIVLHIPGCGQCIEGQFCVSKGTNASLEWIARVKLAGIDRTSTGDGGYANVDVTSQATELSIGATYPILLAPGYAAAAFAEYFTVWMDLDRDGQFTPGEKVFDAGSSVTTALNDSLAVPANATPGPVRMRVVMKYNSAPATGCTTFDYGETEDYCVTLINGSTSITEAPQLLHVQLHPQPADQELSISLGHTGALQLVITDVTGRTLIQKSMQGGFITVGTGQLVSGVYLYRLLDHGTVMARGSFVVAH